MIHTIENELIRLSVDDQSCSLISWVDKSRGEELVKIPTADALCRLGCLPHGAVDKTEYRPGPARVVKDSSPSQAERLTLFCSLAVDEASGPIQLTIRAELPAGQTEVSWSLEIENQSQALDVVEILFPCLGGISLGSDWQDNVLVYPHHAGDRIDAPIRTLTSERYMGFSRANSHLENGRWWREINYCGLASMMWMYYYNPDGGIYFGSHDDDFLVTGIRSETGGPENPWMGFAFRKYLRIQPAETWFSKPYVCAASSNDWHFGAQIYRRWFHQHKQALPNPAYLKDEFSLTPVYNLKRLNEVQNTFDRLPEFYRRGKEWFRSHHIFIAAWNTGGFDWNYPQYQPDMELGSPLDLYKACREVIDQDGLVTFYINARIFDIKSDYFEKLGKPWAIKNEKGSPTYETYLNPRTFTVTCPAHAEWRKHIGDTAVWMSQAYGAKGIYLDQLGSAEPFPCYDPSHTHANIGEFNQGYLQLLEDVRSRLKALDPDTFLMIENCGDIYSSYVWGNLVWNGPLYDEFFNMYRYTFPEYQLVAMVNPRRNMEGEQKRQYFYRDMERSVLLGAVLWLASDYYTHADPEIFAYMRQVVDFRARIAPLLANATYLDNDGIAALPEGIAASRWSLPGGQQLLLLGNLNLLEGTSLELRLPGMVRVSSAGCVEPSIDPSPEFTAAPGGLKMGVPASRLSYILLSE